MRSLLVAALLARRGPRRRPRRRTAFAKRTTWFVPATTPAPSRSTASSRGSGSESATLYWNWAQAATARGAQGEALWALLRARELDPGDRAVVRDVERLREALNLDPAEIAPEPLAVAGRFARRFQLDLVAAVLLALSVVLHGLARTRFRPAAANGLAWGALVLGLVAAAVPLVASLARPTATVVRRGAPFSTPPRPRPTRPARSARARSCLCST